VLSSYAQKRLTASTTTKFDVLGTVVSIDSNEYIYNSWQGSILSYEPVLQFSIPKVNLFLTRPETRWDVKNTYNGTSFPLTYSETTVNSFIGGNLEVSESSSLRMECIYDGAGNLTNRKWSIFNGTGFDLYLEEQKEYDANNNKTVLSNVYHNSGVPIIETIDSFFYDGSNNLIRFIKHAWDGNSLYFENYESLLTYVGSELISNDYYEGDQLTPLTLKSKFDYSYSAGNLVNILEYKVVGGVFDENPTTISLNTFEPNNKLKVSSYYVSNEAKGKVEFSYDTEGFVKKMKNNIWDIPTSSLFTYSITNYYYQSTVGLQDVEMIEAQIFPNPTTDFIKIVTASEIQSVAIFNSNGALVLTQNSGDIVVSNLPAGQYHVQVKTNLGLARKIFIKQ
jgi:hypothetical protein